MSRQPSSLLQQTPYAMFNPRKFKPKQRGSSNIPMAIQPRVQANRKFLVSKQCIICHCCNEKPLLDPCIHVHMTRTKTIIFSQKPTYSLTFCCLQKSGRTKRKHLTMRQNRSKGHSNQIIERKFPISLGSLITNISHEKQTEAS